VSHVVVIDHRFCGPADSGNGGYTCGMIARHVGNPAEVTLRQPPPLDRPLAVQRADDGAGVYDGDTLIAEARPVETVAVDVPEPVSFADAGTAAADSWIVTRPEGHPFPTCFVCGPGRAVGDGLRVFVGPVGDRVGVYAAPWVPDASLRAPADEEHVAPEFVWATLDCSGGIGGLYDAFESGVPHVLGRFTAEMITPVAVGDGCVALGWQLGADGRKVQTGSALFGGDGRLVGRARATWIRLQ
jgi:hypothetical protein